MGTVAQFAEPGDVVGVQMGIDGLDQPKVEFAQQLAVAIDLFQHGSRISASPPARLASK